jgi:hypothetical protein
MAKKVTTKRTTRKASVTRKSTTRKAHGVAGRKAVKATAQKLQAALAGHGALIRRPAVNQPPQPGAIDLITDTVLGLIADIDQYTANLRALDRQRHNGVGLKRLGFIEAAFRVAKEFPQYLPHWLTVMKFQNDILLFRSINSLVDACRSLEEKVWNINVESSDMIYTNGLEYYSQVQDAAERRVDAAETIYLKLQKFFKNLGHNQNSELGEAPPTQKKTKRDLNALMRGTKDGEVIIRNVRPKLVGGTHEIIDQTFKNDASFKETDEGSIK